MQQITSIKVGFLVEEAMAQFIKECCLTEGLQRAPMKEVSIELEGPTKSQNGTEIDQHPLLFGDEVSFAFTRSFGDPTQDSTNDNIYLEMELVSIYTSTFRLC